MAKNKQPKSGGGQIILPSANAPVAEQHPTGAGAPAGGTPAQSGTPPTSNTSNQNPSPQSGGPTIPLSRGTGPSILAQIWNVIMALFVEFWRLISQNRAIVGTILVMTGLAIAVFWAKEQFFSKPEAKSTPATEMVSTNAVDIILERIDMAREDIRNRVPDRRPTGGTLPRVASAGTSGLPADVTAGTITAPPVPSATGTPAPTPASTTALTAARTKVVARGKGIKELHTNAAGDKITYHDCVDVDMWPSEQLLAVRSLEEHITFHHIPGSKQEYFVQYQKSDGSLSQKFTFGDNGNDIFDDGVRTATNFIITPKLNEVVKVGIKYLPK